MPNTTGNRLFLIALPRLVPSRAAGRYCTYLNNFPLVAQGCR
jgi:hypothetical protein